MIIKQWHLYVVNLESVIGTKPGKQRPCLAIQPSLFSETGLKSTVLLPLTTHLRDESAYPIRVRISKGLCGLTRDSDIMVDQILSWDNTLIKSDLGKIPGELQERVKEALQEFLDL